MRVLVTAASKHKSTAEIADRIGAALRRALAGSDPTIEVDIRPPVDTAPIIPAVGARDHRVFAGRLDHRRLGFAGKAIVIAPRAPDGDFRDWEGIDGWATTIAEALRAPVASMRD